MQREIARYSELVMLIHGKMEAANSIALRVFRSVGSNLNDIVKTTVFLSDIKNYGEFTKTYAEVFKVIFILRI